MSIEIANARFAASMAGPRTTARAPAARGRPVPAPSRRAKPGEGPREVARLARASLYREHILIAAEAVFAEQGFESAKVQDISRKAELSMGSIYANFPSKEHLFQSLVERRGGELRDLVAAVVADEADPVATLEALSRAYVTYFFAHPDFLRMHIRTGASWALEPGSDAERRALSQRIHDLQAGIFARGVAARVFIDENPAYLSVLFTGIDQAHLSHWVATGMKGSCEDLLEGFLRVVRRTFLRGDGPTNPRL